MNDAAIRYLGAQVRLVTGRSTQGWSDLEILESSLFCPSSGLSLDEWCAGMEAAIGGAVQSKPKAQPVDEHEKAIAELQSMIPGVKYEKVDI